MDLSEEQIKVFNSVIRNFQITLKNSVFYASDHPIYIYSINNFKTSMDKWFSNQDEFNLGISQDNLSLNGTFLEKKEDFYSEVASYLHVRGLSALSISKGIDIKELNQFFDVIRDNRKIIKEKGGILKNIKACEHLKVQELDYSALLVRENMEVAASEEEKVWQFLFNITDEIKLGKLPESKVKFLIDFFTDTEKSASTLNKVYKEAVTQLQDEETVENIRESVAQICQYFEKYSSDEAKKIKVKLMNVITQLHPDLISMLFEKTVRSDHEFDLAEEITSNFSESDVADFIESLVSNEDTFNENLLKVFDKLAPDAEKSDNMVLMVADRLFSKRILNPNTLSELQMSIKEIFKKHPESNFMNQIYKITVDAVVNKKIDTLVYVTRLTPLINKFVQSMEEGELKKDELWLLLNILWFEDNPAEFNIFTEKIVSILPDLLDSKDTARLKDVVEFFTEMTRPEQQKDESMVKEIKGGLQKIISKETIDSIVSLIPEANKTDIENVTYILTRSGADSAKYLIDAFLAEKIPAHRNKFMFIFLKMKRRISNEVVDRLAYCESVVVRDLFAILNRCAPNKAHLVAKKLINHKDAQIRWVALEEFKPRTKEETLPIFAIFNTEKNSAVKKRAATVLLKTRNSEIINKLFSLTERGLFKRKFLTQLVELCGLMRVQESFLQLKSIFLKRALFNTRKRDDFRVATVTSLGRLETDEAMELVKKGLSDRSRRVRHMSELVLQLDEEERKIPSKYEVQNAEMQYQG